MEDLIDFLLGILLMALTAGAGAAILITVASVVL